MPRLPVIVSLLIGALAFSDIGTHASAQQGVRLSALATAHGIVDDKPMRPTRVFASDDPAVFVWYSADGCTTEMTIRSIWFYLGTDPPLAFSEGTVTVDRPGNWGQFNYGLAPGRRWPIGRYRIELRIGDQSMAETYFCVVAAQTADIPATDSNAQASSVDPLCIGNRPIPSSGR